MTALRNQTTYYCEYRRIIDETPKVLSQTFFDHKAEVGHVTFSHDGTMFSTVSKDCTLKVRTHISIKLSTSCKKRRSLQLTTDSWFLGLDQSSSVPVKV